MTLIRLTVAWFLGLGIAAAWPLPWPLALTSAALVLGLGWALGRRQPPVTWLWLMVFVCLGAARAGWANRPAGEADVGNLIGGGKVTLRGLVAAEPARGERG